ncbi:MAG TPA: ABC transporter ATP-binding protein [Thermoleophilaceae bacterium]|nr:ABC transporter ATP-binding protein [Thermoleophilaceae bacterium]
MTTAPAALEVQGLTKRYDDGTLAVEDFDLSVPDGAFFGLLGPNGAGKTTLISAVCNLIRITAGEVLVFGEPAASLEARSWTGLAEQDINLDRFLTVRETLVYHGGYFGMGGDEAEARADEMIDAFDLRAKSGVRTPKLSGGQRRRLLLARALMHRPRLVILDEPTAGVDFELRLELWRYIRQLHAEGTTILLTTHYLDEADRLAARLAIVDRGRVVVEGTPDQLKGELRGDAVHIELREAADERAVRRALEALPGVRDVAVEGRLLRARADDGAATVPAALAALDDARLAVATVTVARPSLDDVYLRHAGRRFAEAEAA